MEQSPNVRGNTLLSTVLTVVAAVVIAGVVGFWLVHKTKAPTGTVTNFNQPTDSNTNASSKNDVQVYESPRLGIRFKYAAQDNGQRVLVKETGDTIYVYTQGTVPEQGQFVRVWTKDLNESLQQAVKTRFLKGYSEQRCFVTSWVDNVGTKPSTGVTAVVSFPIGPTDSTTPWWDNGKHCPQNYTVSNGLAYFWTDDERSERFVYFSIGQYVISGETPDTSWHTTFEFIR